MAAFTAAPLPPAPENIPGTRFCQHSQYSDLLQAGRSGLRILVGGEIFCTRPYGPGAHPSCYTMGTGSFLGIEWLGRGVDQPPHLTVRLKKE